MLGLGLPLIIAFISIPVLINELGVARFGVLTIIWAVVSYFGLFDLGLGRAVTQQVAIALSENRHDRLDMIVGTSSAIMAGLGIVGGVVLLAAANLLADNLAIDSGTEEVKRSFYWMAVAMPAIVLTSGYRGILEASGRFALVNMIRVPMGAFTYGGPLVAVWLGFAQLDEIAGVLAVGRIAACVIHAGFALQNIGGRIGHGRLDRELVGPLLKFGGWLSVMNLFGPLIGYIDRFIIGIVIGPQAAAYFVTPQEVATKVSLIPMAVSSAIFPNFAASGQKEAKDVASQINRYSALNGIITFFPALAIALFSHEIISLWIGAEFANSTSIYLSIFAFGCFVNSLAHVPLTYIIARNGSKKGSLLYFCEAVVYAFAIYAAALHSGLLACVWVWLARIVFDTLAFYLMAIWQTRSRSTM